MRVFVNILKFQISARSSLNATLTVGRVPKTTASNNKRGLDCTTITNSQWGNKTVLNKLSNSSPI